MSMQRKQGFYEKYVKRLLDIICAALAIVVFGWLYIFIAILVRVNLGKPVLFKQARPGIIDPKSGMEQIFEMYKFRTMTDDLDEKGNLLPDVERLTPFGKMLRSTSLDELPEAFNILLGDMSVVGPRPQLVRDMVFMTDEQRLRHTAKPGLTGLAQVQGRNAITWDEKIALDLQYTRDISFIGDVRIVLLTVKKVFFHGEKDEELNVTDDYGDALLKEKKITKERYDALQARAKQLLESRK